MRCVQYQLTNFGQTPLMLVVENTVFSNTNCEYSLMLDIFNLLPSSPYSLSMQRLGQPLVYILCP